MLGLTVEQYQSIVSFVNKHFASGKYYKPEDRTKNREFFRVVYIESSYDIRDSCIWNVRFVNGANYLMFATNIVTPLDNSIALPFNNLYDWIMAYLTGQWEIPTNLMTVMNGTNR